MVENGETALVPERSLTPKSPFTKIQEVALVELQVKIEESPRVMVRGFAIKSTETGKGVGLGVGDGEGLGLETVEYVIVKVIVWPLAERFCGPDGEIETE